MEAAHHQLISSIELKKKPPGDFDYRSDGIVYIAKWNDNAIVGIASNCLTHELIQTVNRRVKSAPNIAVQQPFIIRQYRLGYRYFFVMTAAAAPVRVFATAAPILTTSHEMHVITSSEDVCRQWCTDVGLLAANMVCWNGSSVMEEAPYTRSIGGLTWRCPQQGCRNTTNLHKGSFFEKSQLPPTKLADHIWMWSKQASNFETTGDLGTSPTTTVNWFSYMCDICSNDLIWQPIQLGGPGHIVAIDE